ncbi:MAG: Nif3-like dinuclear metal center hexameric protein [Candidatus Nanohaloarchaea archaeon]
MIQETIDEGSDFFVTGNVGFPTNIYIHEKGLDTIEMEETSSEKWGVYALGEHLQKEFPGLELHRIEERNW